ncbi:MAG: tryptophan--tRNA ligase [Halobacteriovoraceae bacterium]|nr:tryptophan--tRNA ligase [Halobacteriovoraceae bacterium]|tara:strand:- start:8370 stop:9368 length:999 start_codon:yes stop_codon:yes gene_type:complete
MKTVLTGIKPTGDVHLGNLLGAIRPAIEMSQSNDFDRSIYFIADAHALTSVRDPKLFKNYVYEIAATWLALGLDSRKSIFFKQSDVKEVFELTWLLNCMTPKGDMNRAHSYKDRVQKNNDEGRDADHGVNMGLYSYPILMSADILLYDTNFVPVGKDQIQHVEIARSIAQRCNEYYGAGTLIEPKEVIQESGSYVPGLDGRKMSKSYGNVISLWGTEKQLRKTIMKIKTDSSPPEAPKDPDKCIIMEMYRLFATSEQVSALEVRYREGIGWGHAKEALFEVVNDYLKTPREKFNHFMSHTHEIDQILEDGADRARMVAKDTMGRVRSRITGF